MLDGPVRGCGPGDLESAADNAQRLLDGVLLPPPPAVRLPRVTRQGGAAMTQFLVVEYINCIPSTMRLSVAAKPC